VFGPQFLNDADGDIGQDHRHKSQVVIGADGKDTSGQNKEDQIKICKDVVFEDLRDRFCGRHQIFIVIAVVQPFSACFAVRPSELAASTRGRTL
jgi:hypothetical protein